ncbi:MAG: hypothetical protein HC789_07805 [Microcoleus sp. CSU_2_2]|nr:hypothetical protein [Microcoleus sp. CSU_2_2]
MRRYEQLSLLLGDLIATHHTNYNGDGKPGFGINYRPNASPRPYPTNITGHDIMSDRLVIQGTIAL